MRRALLILAVSLVVVLTVAETALQVSDYLGLSYYENALAYQQAKIPDQGSLYRQQAGMSTAFGSMDFVTNRQGLRSGPIGPHNPDRFRVLFLGDSVTLGWGVRHDQTFVYGLRQFTGYEVVNAGVGGYNSQQEMAYFINHGLDLQPDLVCLLYCPNDIEWAHAAKPIKRDSREWWRAQLLHSRIYALCWHLHASRQERRATGSIAESLKCVDMIWDACRANRIPFIVYYLDYWRTGDTRTIWAHLEANADSTGYLAFDTSSWFPEDMGPLVNSRVDSHPNARGHAVLRDGIYSTWAGLLGRDSPSIHDLLRTRPEEPKTAAQAVTDRQPAAEDQSRGETLEQSY